MFASVADCCKTLEWLICLQVWWANESMVFYDASRSWLIEGRVKCGGSGASFLLFFLTVLFVSICCFLVMVNRVSLTRELFPRFETQILS